MIDPNEVRLESMHQYSFGTDTMKSIKICGICGAVSSVSESICAGCGEKLPEDTLFQMYKSRHISCASCATVVSDNARFCPKCGEKIRA